MLGRTTSRAIVGLTKNNVRNFSAISLKEEFPGTPTSSPSTESSKATVSTASNGVVVSSNEQGKVATVGVIVGSGGATGKEGTALALSSCAFKASTGKSSLKMVRDIQMIGGSFGTSADRTSIKYWVNTAPSDVGVAFDSIAETVTSPYLPDWIMTEIASDFSEKKAAIAASPLASTMESLYESSYRLTDLGKSMVGEVSVADLLAFRESEYVAENMTVVGSGVSHEELVAFAESLDVAKGSGSEVSSKFTPGFHYAKTGVPAVVVAYEVPSAKAAAIKVLTSMWGASSFVHVNGSTTLIGMYGDDSDALVGQMTGSVSFAEAKAKAMVDSALDLSLASIASPVDISSVTEADVAAVASSLQNPSVLTVN